MRGDRQVRERQLRGDGERRETGERETGERNNGEIRGGGIKTREEQTCSGGTQEVSNNPIRLTPMLPWLQQPRVSSHQPTQKRSTIRMNVTPAQNENNNHSMWWVMEGRYYGDGGTRAACSHQGSRASGQLGLSTILLINKTPKD